MKDVRTASDLFIEVHYCLPCRPLDQSHTAWKAPCSVSYNWTCVFRDQVSTVQTWNWMQLTCSRNSFSGEQRLGITTFRTPSVRTHDSSVRGKRSRYEFDSDRGQIRSNQE